MELENNKIIDLTYFCETDFVNKTEKWKDVPGYEGIYQVSDLGRLKSLPRLIKKPNGNSIQSGKLFPINHDKRGYCTVHLYKNTKHKTTRLHVLVAMAFLNHIPDKFKIIVDHVNNIKTDNRLCNLQLISQRYNTIKDKKNKNRNNVGVYYRKERNKPYECQIGIGKERIYLGSYNTEQEASVIYNKATSIINYYDGDKQKFRKLAKS